MRHAELMLCLYLGHLLLGFKVSLYIFFYYLSLLRQMLLAEHRPKYKYKLVINLNTPRTKVNLLTSCLRKEKTYVFFRNLNIL